MFLLLNQALRREHLFEKHQQAQDASRGAPVQVTMENELSVRSERGERRKVSR